MSELSEFKGETVLPKTELPELDTEKPLYIYNGYNLDPNWDREVDANRLLLLEPSHFRRFPIGTHVLQFIIDLSKNIEGIKIYTGEVNAIPNLRKFPQILSKEHPAFRHYPGIKTEREWMFPGIKVNHTSFFRFWRQAERMAKKSFSLDRSPISVS